MSKIENYYSVAIESWRAGDHQKARSNFKKILKSQPNNSEIISYLGILELQNQNFDQGIRSLKFAHKLSPDNENIKINLANGLIDFSNFFIKKKTFKEASNLLEESLELLPNNEHALINLIKVNIHLKNYTKVKIFYDILKNINIKNPELYYLYGNALFDQKKFQEALEYFKKASDLKSDFFQSVFHQAICYEFLNDFDNALKKYDECLEINQDYKLALLNKSQLLLANEKYASAWSLYQNRWFSNLNIGKYFLNRENEFKNIEEKDKRVFVWAEQGIGDQILFSSMLNDFQNLVHNLTVSIDERLYKVFTRSFPKINFINQEQALNFQNYDAHLPMGNLGLYVRTKLSDFANQKKNYLSPDNLIRDKFLLKYKESKKILCGISFLSNKNIFSDSKSINIEELANYLPKEKIRYINLDYVENYNLIKKVSETHNLDYFDTKEIDKYNDLESLIALISCCDVIITISNVTAHLAGSLGIKTYLLAPYNYGRFWYWSDKKKSKWYPSIEINRQKKQHDWLDNFAELEEKLLMESSVTK